MLNLIFHFLEPLRRLLTRHPGTERRGSGLAHSFVPARRRPQLDAQQTEFARWERAENRFRRERRRERRRVWWLAQQGIEAGPSPVLGVVVGW